jgi:hypothetical protein
MSRINCQCDVITYNYSRLCNPAQLEGKNSVGAGSLRRGTVLMTGELTAHFFHVYAVPHPYACYFYKRSRFIYNNYDALQYDIFFQVTGCSSSAFFTHAQQCSPHT